MMVATIPNIAMQIYTPQSIVNNIAWTLATVSMIDAVLIFGVSGKPDARYSLILFLFLPILIRTIMLPIGSQQVHACAMLLDRKDCELFS